MFALKSVVSRFAPVVVVGLGMLAFSEGALAAGELDSLLATVKPMMTSLQTVITEYGGYILAALGVLTVIGILRKLL